MICIYLPFVFIYLINSFMIHIHLNSVLIQKECHLLWSKYKLSQYFEDRNIDKLEAFSCEIH